MNFEGFKNLVSRVAREWFEVTWREHKADFQDIREYLQESPFTAKHTKANEDAYEKLMDTRMKLYELSAEIDAYKSDYMDFVEQTLESESLMRRATEDLTTEERHLVELELMILEQVADWEAGAPDAPQTPKWAKSRPLVVMLPNGSTRTISIQQPAQRRYWFAMCPVSCKIGEVKLCAGCKAVGYIGKDEQKEDWPKHKKVCKILKEARRGGPHWLCSRSPEKMSSALRAGLTKEEFGQFEVDLTDFPRVCVVCGQGERQDALKDCRKCYGVAFCRDCCGEDAEKLQKHHDEDTCKAMKLCAEDYRHEMKVGHQVQQYAPKVSAKYSPLSGDSESLFADEVPAVVSNKLPGYQESELRFLTFLYTCPLSVLFGAESSGMRVEARESLVVHLVGSRRAELRHLTGWEILACRLPKLKLLKFVFVGDESESASGQIPREFEHKGNQLEEKRKDLRVVYEFPPPALYQDFARGKTFVKPDLVAALDCGFKFYPDWKDAIKTFLSFSGCPLVFTEFNEADMEDNLKLVKSVAADSDVDLEVCLPPQKNPFRGTRPSRCSDKTGNYRPHSVVYTNDYICAVESHE